MYARTALPSSLLVLAALACGDATSDDADATRGGGGAPASGPGLPGAPGAPEDGDAWARGPKLGARRLANGDLEVRVRAPNATRLELCLFAKATGESEKLRLPMTREKDTFALKVAAAALREAGIGDVVFYGLRAFGASWTYDPAWKPGSQAGFVADVGPDGDRMNPNKLLLDPYALEVSHDPITTTFADGSVYRTGAATRAVDSGPFAPKGVDRRQGEGRVYGARVARHRRRHADERDLHGREVSRRARR
jgi:glycogen operon protein